MNNTDRTPNDVGEFPPWQLILGGISLTVFGMIAGAKLSETILPLLMPGVFG